MMSTDMYVPSFDDVNGHGEDGGDESTDHAAHEMGSNAVTHVF